MQSMFEESVSTSHPEVCSCSPPSEPKTLHYGTDPQNPGPSDDIETDTE